MLNKLSPKDRHRSKTIEALIAIIMTLGIFMILAAGNALFSEEFLPWGLVLLIIGVALLVTTMVIAKRK